MTNGSIDEEKMMFDAVRVIQSEETSVKKLVFTKDSAVAEAVLYKYPTYEDRTVICCSTMSGCPVGCRFCGAGDYFARSLSAEEIVYQVDRAIEESATEASAMNRLQIMFMSMGEPLLNRAGMTRSLRILHREYPNAALLISTIGPDIDYEWVHGISEDILTIGLQFSIHKSIDETRNELIPFKGKLSIAGISEVGEQWMSRTGRKPFFNYCAGDDNSYVADADRLLASFRPDVWECTVSVICERNEGLPARNERQEALAHDFSGLMTERGFNVRVFDPAGQDDIGGGCGQLWFVQDWMRSNPDKVRPSIGYGLPEVHTPGGYL